MPKKRPDFVSRRIEKIAESIAQGLADGKYHLEDADNDRQEEQRTKNTVQQEPVEFPRPL